MKYNLKNPDELDEAFSRLSDLAGKEALIELTRISPKRSLSQNAYLHVTFGTYGLETGYDTQEAKTIYKRYANPSIYVYEKNSHKFLRSSADLTVKEMTDSIEKWRKYAAEQGVDIPAPEDKEALIYWQNQIEQNNYL